MPPLLDLRTAQEEAACNLPASYHQEHMPPLLDLTRKAQEEAACNLLASYHQEHMPPLLDL
eukprot:1041736-Pelagomonas_calceolata.AAC.1